MSNAVAIQLHLSVDQLPEHPWLPTSWVTGDLSGIDPGTVVQLVGEQGAEVGIAVWNPKSHAPLRLLSRSVEPIDHDWFSRRFKSLEQQRRSLLPNETAFRWVYGDADGLPGLVVDRYGDAASVQVRSLAMERMQPLWLGALQSEGLELIVERSDFAGRKAEGLEPFAGILAGEAPTRRLIQRGGLTFEVDLMNGPKTGFYLDQLQTSLRLQAEVRQGERVADLFCSVGQLAVAAAAAGGEVTAVDIDPNLEAIVKRNAELNGRTVRFESGNVFDWLAVDSGTIWDRIILDPPAIAKHRGQKRSLLSAIYKMIVLSAKKTAPGGTLIVCKCSHQVSVKEMQDTCAEAIKDARRRIQEVAQWGQPSDHPVPNGFPEAEYLAVLALRLN